MGQQEDIARADRPETPLSAVGQLQAELSSGQEAADADRPLGQSPSYRARAACHPTRETADLTDPESAGVAEPDGLTGL